MIYLSQISEDFRIRYNPAFDGLRGIAITSVVFFHAFPTKLRGGWIGVELFFVLSGYLVTSLLLHEKEQTKSLDLRNFYIRRALRILPALFALVIVQIIRAILSDAPSPILQSAAVTAASFMNWNRAFSLFPQDVIGHTWSLSMEEQYYLIWPILLATLSVNNTPRLILSAIVGVFLWRNYLILQGSDINRIYNGFDTHCDGLLMGTALSLVVQRIKLTHFSALVYAFAVLALVASILFQDYRTSYTASIGFSIISLSSAIVIWACNFINPLQSILANRPLTYLGSISYGWYIWHFPIILLLPPYLTNSGLSPTIAQISGVIVSFLCGILSTELIEAPWLKLKASFQPRVMSE